MFPGMPTGLPMRASASSPFRLSPAVSLAAVVTLTLIAYLPSLGNNFFNLDDPVYIKSVAKWTVPNVLGLFLHGREGYHPLALLTLSANYLFGGLNPFGYHLVNLLLHLANTAFVFILTRKIVPGGCVALATALLFGLHPVHVESVAWVSSRKDVQYAFFYLLALLCHESFLRSRRWRLYAMTLALGLLAILSKGMAVSLPLSLLLVDFAKGRSLTDKKVWLEKMPFFALGLVFGAVSILTQQARGYVPSGGTMAPLAERLATAAYALGMYLYNFFIPLRLCAYHPCPETGWREILLGIAAVFIVAFLLAVALRRSRLVLFSLLFFLANIVLVLQLVPVSTFIIADRYNYISSIGLCLLVGLGIEAAARRSKKMVFLSIAALVLIAAAAGWHTFNRCLVWKDTLSIWTDVLRLYPRAVLPLQDRACEYYAAGEFALADRDLSLAIEHAPYRTELRLLRGATRSRLGDMRAALDDLNMAVRLEPQNARAYMSRGLVFYELREVAPARDDFSKAIELSHGKSAQAYSHRAMVRIALNDLQGALSDANHAVDLAPYLPGARANRAIALEKLNRNPEALIEWRHALNLDPTSAQAARAVARLESAMKDHLADTPNNATGK